MGKMTRQEAAEIAGVDQEKFNNPENSALFIFVENEDGSTDLQAYFNKLSLEDRMTMVVSQISQLSKDMGIPPQLLLSMMALNVDEMEAEMFSEGTRVEF